MSSEATPNHDSQPSESEADQPTTLAKGLESLEDREREMEIQNLFDALTDDVMQALGADLENRLTQDQVAELQRRLAELRVLSVRYKSSLDGIEPSIDETKFEQIELAIKNIPEAQEPRSESRKEQLENAIEEELDVVLRALRELFAFDEAVGVFNNPDLATLKVVASLAKRIEVVEKNVFDWWDEFADQEKSIQLKNLLHARKELLELNRLRIIKGEVVAFEETVNELEKELSFPEDDVRLYYSGLRSAFRTKLQGVADEAVVLAETATDRASLVSFDQGCTEMRRREIESLVKEIRNTLKTQESRIADLWFSFWKKALPYDSFHFSPTLPIGCLGVARELEDKLIGVELVDFPLRVMGLGGDFEAADLIVKLDELIARAKEGALKDVDEDLDGCYAAHVEVLLEPAFRVLERLREIADGEREEEEGEDIETESGILSRMEKLWNIIVTSEVPTKGSDSNPTSLGNKLELLDLAEKLELEFGYSGMVKRWTNQLYVFDGFLKTAGKDFMQELAPADATELRSRIQGEVKLHEIAELLAVPEIREVVKMAENLMFAGTIKYVDLRGEPLVHPVTRNPMIDAEGKPYTHNYAMSGNPTQREIALGQKVSFKDHLKLLFADKSIKDSVFDAVVMVVILGELRLKANVVPYALYARSPTSFDLKPIEEASLAAAIHYGVRSKAIVDPEKRRFFDSIRMPRELPVGMSASDVRVVNSTTGELVPVNADVVTRALHPGIPSVIMAPPEGVANDTQNIVDATLARGIAHDLLTTAELPNAEIGFDFQHIPMVWDLCTAAPGSNYHNITLQKYTEICAAQNEFFEQVESKPNIQSVQALKSAIEEGIRKYSRNKGMIPTVEGSPYEKVYKDLLKAVYLRYLKEIFDQYNLKATTGDESSRRQIFVVTALQVIKAHGTCPRFIKDFLIETLEAADTNNIALFKLRVQSKSNPSLRKKVRFIEQMQILFSSERPMNAKARANTSPVFNQYYGDAEHSNEGADAE